MNRLSVTISLLFAFSLSHAQQNFDTVKIRPVVVSEHIYMLKGSGGNIGVLAGPDGILMIDDQFAPLSNKIHAAIRAIDGHPLRFLINTHIHGDHSGGNENFKNFGFTIVAHDQVRERMMQSTTNDGKTVPPRPTDAWPVISFPDKMNFHLNGEDIELLHLGRGHTDGDVIVHFKKANVYHMGDAFVRYGYPYIDTNSGGSVNGFIAALDKMLFLLDDQSKVIPGHGEVATKADVKLLRDQLADLRDQVATALKKGKKPEEISGMPFASKYDAQLGSDFLKGKDFVTMMANDFASQKIK
jgi:glyoxylase-like metal-dependent hydrolase (beta-lactamase superfamily II)